MKDSCCLNNSPTLPDDAELMRPGRARVRSHVSWCCLYLNDFFCAILATVSHKPTTTQTPTKKTQAKNIFYIGHKVAYNVGTKRYLSYNVGTKWYSIKTNSYFVQVITGGGFFSTKWY